MSQILVGIVLAFMAAVLYKTSADTIAVRSANDTRALGSRVAQRESDRIDRALAAVDSLKDRVAGSRGGAASFIAAARGVIAANAAIDIIDEFDADGGHVAHVDAAGRHALGSPPRVRSLRVPSSVIDAVDLVLNESSVTRMIASSHAIRIRAYNAPASAPAGLYVFVGQPIVRRRDVLGTIVARIDVQRLLVNDVARALPGRFKLDDGSGRLDAGSAGGLGAAAEYAQTFTIPFADRRWSLLLAPPQNGQTAKPWLFVLIWLIAWSAISVPIEVVGQINRRVRVLNEGLEARVAARTRELEHQMRVRADFIGTASHELRTPATTLRTLSALLTRKVLPSYPFSEDDAKLIGMLEFETRRLATLVDDLLEVAVIDAPETPVAQSDVDVCAVVRAEVEGTFGLDPRPAAAIELDLPPGPTLVRGDENALRRVIVNLVGNARKFTPSDGRVSVKVEPAGDRVRLIVRDTGVGIPEADLPHVFERFYRAERPGTEIRGTGLGLAIVARLVERMHGTVALSSEVGQGTTVSVDLRAARA